MEPSPFRKIRTVFAALLAAAATGAAIPASSSTVRFFRLKAAERQHTEYSLPSIRVISRRF